MTTRDKLPNRKRPKDWDKKLISGAYYKICTVIMSLDEKSLEKLLHLEAAGQNRKNVLRRIHQRYTRVRAERELGEILNRKTPTKRGKQ